MKYNLLENTKYLLRENYLLNEKYILTEAGGVSVVDVNVTNIQKAYQNLEAMMKSPDFKASDTDKTAETGISKIDDTITMLDGQLMHTKDPEIIKGKTLEAVNSIDQLARSNGIDISKFTLNDGTNYFTKLRDLASSSDNKKIKEITSIVKELRKVFNVTRKSATATVSTKNFSVKDLETTINNLKNFEQFLNASPKASINNVKLGNLLADCISSSDGYLNAIATGKTEDAARLLEELRTFCVELSNALKKELQSQGFKASNAEANNIDWATRFKELKPEQFWKEYYEEYWGHDANRVARLGKVFRDQCEKFGWTDKTNPFIVFLKQFLIAKGWDISEGHWTAINNACASGVFTTINLTKFDQDYNILYCKDFYSKNATEAEQYLDYYRDIQELDAKTAFDSAGGSDTAKAIVSHFDISNVVDKSQFFFLILYAHISLDELQKEVTTATNVSGLKSETEKLRPLNEVTHILKTLNPRNGEIKKFTKDTKQQLIDDILKLSNKPSDQAKYLRVIVSKFMLDTDAALIYKDYKKIDSAIVSGTEEIQIIQFVYKYANRVSKEDVKNIIDGVQEKLIAADPNFDLKK